MRAVAEVMGRVRFGGLPGGKWWRRGFGVSPLLVLQGVGGLAALRRARGGAASGRGAGPDEEASARGGQEKGPGGLLPCRRGPAGAVG